MERKSKLKKKTLFFSDSQLDFIKSKYTFNAFIGGLGSGKSHALVWRLVLDKIQANNEKHVSGLYSIDFKQIELVLFPRLFDVLDFLEIPYTKKSLLKEITIKNYGTILAYSFDTPERLVGYETAQAYVDEIEQLPYDKELEIWNRIVSRNRQKIKGVKNTVNLSTTPEGFKLAYNLFDAGDIPSRVEKGYKYIRGKTIDNKAIDSGVYVANISQSYTPERLKSYLEGYFINFTTGLVYPYFDEKFNNESQGTIPALELVSEVHIGQDFNLGYCASVVGVLILGMVYIVDELTSNDIFELVNNLKLKYGKKNIHIYPDMSEAKGGLDTLRIIKNSVSPNFRAYIHTPKENRNEFVPSRINSVNTLFYKKKIIIKNSCKKILNSVKSQVYDTKGNPEKQTGKADDRGADHWNDALGYFVARI